ncbi:MAG: hypothetical protein HC769_35375 [Cyanobacteria bacterium CRU_2_1]|nr:hypothetical protein [Cyanobacteria bacterium RU_5_0]NJR63603.1 hypothetical protein [Cyanobacteria bacterium CRU_2_1]
MFLVKDTSLSREERIKQISSDDPPLAALLSIVHFEWTVRRAIIALAKSPNVEVREKLAKCHGLEKYRQIWQDEVAPKRKKNLNQVIQNWDGLKRAFKLRHLLVHGVQSCSSDHAIERINWAIDAATDIRNFCLNQGVDIDRRLPIRRQAKKTKSKAN